MKLLNHLKSTTRAAINRAKKKLRRRTRPKSTAFEPRGITAQDLWFMNYKVVEPKAMKLGQARARQRFLAKLEANKSIPSVPRPPSRQVLRSLHRASHQG